MTGGWYDWVPRVDFPSILNEQEQKRGRFSFFLRGWYTHVLIIGISPGVTLSFFSSLVPFVLLYYILFYCSSDGYIGPSADFGIFQTC